MSKMKTADFNLIIHTHTFSQIHKPIQRTFIGRQLYIPGTKVTVTIKGKWQMHLHHLDVLLCST
jgi:hypothetical protein